MWTAWITLTSSHRTRRLHRYKYQWPEAKTVCGIIVPPHRVRFYNARRASHRPKLCPGCFDYNVHYPLLAGRHPGNYVYKPKG